MRSKSISIRIPIEEYKELKRLSDDSGMGRSTVIRDIIDRGIKDKKLDIAIDKYRKREVTLWKAARMADIPLTKFIDILNSEGLEFHYTSKEVSEEFEGLL